MIQSYDDLYQTVEAVVAEFEPQEGTTEIVFSKNENATCEIKNKANNKKFVLMFARFGDEYKVGFAFYEPDPYGGFTNPEWIDDLSHEDFDQNYVKNLINEHLIDA